MSPNSCSEKYCCTYFSLKSLLVCVCDLNSELVSAPSWLSAWARKMELQVFHLFACKTLQAGKHSRSVRASNPATCISCVRQILWVNAEHIWMWCDAAPRYFIYLMLTVFPTLVQAFPVLDRNEFIHRKEIMISLKISFPYQNPERLDYHTYALLLFLLLAYRVIQKTTCWREHRFFTSCCSYS